MVKYLATVLATVIVIGAGGYLAAPSLMIQERKSPYGFEETVQRLEQSVKDAGWSHMATRRVDETLRKHGREVLPVALVELCKADYAERILREDDARFVSVMMPCTMSVYQKSDGSTYVAAMNTGLMGQVFGGVVAEVMGSQVGPDEARMLAFLDE